MLIGANDDEYTSNDYEPGWRVFIVTAKLIASFVPIVLWVVAFH